MNYKQKALDHVRSVCPELMELSFGCQVQYKNAMWDKMIVLFKQGDEVYTSLEPQQPRKEHLFEIIGHTPHLEHWLESMQQSVLGKGSKRPWVRVYSNGDLEVYDMEFPAYYDFTKDGESQSEEFYKAYCEIVGL